MFATFLSLLITVLFALITLLDALLLLLNQVVHLGAGNCLSFEVTLRLLHMLGDLGSVLLGSLRWSIGMPSLITSVLRTQQLLQLITNLIITLLVLDLPHVILVFLSLLQKSLVTQFLLDDIVTISLIVFISFLSIWVN